MGTAQSDVTDAASLAFSSGIQEVARIPIAFLFPYRFRGIEALGGLGRIRHKKEMGSGLRRVLRIVSYECCIWLMAENALALSLTGTGLSFRISP
jgi:hypothetical protein